MTKNDKGIDKLITKIEKLRVQSQKIIMEYERSMHIVAVPSLYDLCEGIDYTYRAMRSVLIDKKDSQIVKR